MSLLRDELERIQHRYKTEKQVFTKIRAQMKIKERIKRDLGGLTDTVVSSIMHVLYFPQINARPFLKLVKKFC